MRDIMDERQPGGIVPIGPLARHTYKTIVYEKLYELIQNLDLPPGERLVEADLSTRFGVSKTPVREALHLLEREDLVSSVPHVGATVTWLSIHDYEQHLFLQDALEQPALPLAVQRATRESIGTCKTLLEGIRRARQAKAAAEYQRLVIQLHMQLFGDVGFARLTEMIGSVQRSLRRYHPVFVRPFKDNWDRELSIVTTRVECLVSGDVEAAMAAVQQGHRDMLEFARELARLGDSQVLPYLVKDEGETLALSSIG